jgi:Ca-activated chloride channel homolog
MRQLPNRLAGLLLPLFLVCSWGSAQLPPPPPADGEGTTTIKMNVQRVVLYVTVREGKTGFVGDLTKDEFTIKDDGKVQAIHEFSRADVPVAVGLVIDNSQSMMNKKPEVLAAAKAFVHASNPEDEMFVIHFNDNIFYGLPKDKMFSGDHAELDHAIDSMELTGQTALYDAIQSALDHLKETKLTKKALVVISDGGDNRSTAKMDEVVKAADLSGALFYAVAIYDPMDGDAKPSVMRHLAKETGGEAFFPTQIDEITGLCESIARDLRNQYTLVYAPPARINDTKYHRVEVLVKDPKKRKLTVTARSGYYGSEAAAAAQRTKK